MTNFFRILAIACVLMLSACLEDNDAPQSTGASVQGFMGGAPAMAKMEMMVAPSPMPVSPGTDSAAVSQSFAPSGMVLDRSKLGDRKIAETHNLSIETTYDMLQARYQRDYAKCLEMGCEISNSNIQQEQSGFIQARIDPAKLGAFLDFLATGEGRILNHQVTADDQTMEYSDVTAQMDNLVAMRARLRALLDSDKAKDVDGILRIETELNRIQTEIDQRTSRLKILDKITNMATVMLSYQVQYRPAEVQPYTLKNTWKMAVQKFLAAVDRVIQFVGAVLPWLPVIFIGFWLGVRMVRFAFVKTRLRLPWRNKP